jgi:hypothetical protein
MGLSEELTRQFDTYISVIVTYLQSCDIKVVKTETPKTLLEIIDTFKYPTHS